MSRKVALVSAIALFGVVVNFAHAQTVVDELERGGTISWQFLGGNYIISGGINTSGTISPGSPITFPFQDLNNDGLALDILLRIQDLIPDLGVNRNIPLIAQVISNAGSSAVIQWTGTDNPNECIQVDFDGTVINVLVTELFGQLRGLVERIPCQPDPLGLLPHNSHLRVTMTGGNTFNVLRLRGYVFCIQIPQTFTTAEIVDGNWIGYGGGLPKRLGNVNGDCVVDDADLLQVLFNFGGSDSASDTNSDGVVDDADLLTVLFNFGASV